MEYFTDVDTMLPNCDFVAICCPLNEKSQYMFKKKQFQLMKTTSILINISRGKNKTVLKYTADCERYIEVFEL